MAEASEQFALEFPVTPRFGLEDFLVSDSNEQAFLAIEGWSHWPDPVLLLLGPSGAGKSHLAAIFAARAHGWTVKAGDVTTERVPHLASAGALVIDDCDAGGIDETALFHLLNAVRARNGVLLLTATRRPDDWGLLLPDLLSRLRLAPMVLIEAPDNALLRALTVKLFLDRQLLVDTAVVESIVNRSERSFAAIHTIVDQLDRAALAAGRRLTRGFVGEFLARAEATATES